MLNLSSFATGSSLWAELSRLVVLGVILVKAIFGPWSFLLFRFRSMVLFFCFCSWLCGLSSASIRSIGDPLLLSLLGAFRLPVWAGFLSFRSLSSSLPFLGFFCTLSLLCLFFYTYFQCGSCLFYSLFPCLCFVFNSWRRAPGNFPLSSHHASALVLQAALGCCAWHLPLSPLVCCVHGDSTASSKPYRTLILASTSMPAGLLCPWYSVACLLPYRLLC